MELLITFVITNYSIMRSHWERNAGLKDKGILGTNKPIGRDVDLGGLIVKLDWDRKKIVAQKELKCPSGFDYKNGVLYVASMRDNEIYCMDDELNIKRKIQNPYFNDIHSLNSTNKGLIVTSSGLDCILELNGQGQILFEWWATDNGFNNDQYGNVRDIEKNLDHRGIDYPTLFQTTHVNSAIYSDDSESRMLVCLFHQGEVVEISKNKGYIRTILSGLKSPHSIYAIDKYNYIVSDTKNSRIIFFDYSGEPLESPTTMP